MLRFEDVPTEINDIFREVRAEHFPELRNANIKILYDLKKRQSNGKITLARIQKTNDLLRYLTIDESAENEGHDYIIFIDKKIFDNITREEKIKILRHELRHTLVDIDSNTPYKLIPHDIEDFHEEIELNKNEPMWRQRLANLCQDLYGQEADDRE